MTLARRVIADAEAAGYRLGRDLGWAACAGLLVVVGAGFLVAGIWTLIAAVEGAAMASLLVGGGLVLLGVAVLIVRAQIRRARLRREEARRAAARQAVDPAVLAETFLLALEAGKTMRR